MTYATSTDKVTGERPVLLLEIAIPEDSPTTTYYFSTVPVVDDTNGRIYEPRILSAGSLDRALMGSTPGGQDVVMRLDGKDGGLDSLFSDFTGSGTNIVKGKVTIKRGFKSLAIANFQTVAVLQFARLISMNDQRVFTVEFKDKSERLFGAIVPPTVGEVLAALEVADSTLYDRTPEFDSSTGIHWENDDLDDIVPVAIGTFGSTAILTKMHAVHHGSINGGFSGFGRGRALSIVAVSPYAITAYPVVIREVDGEGNLVLNGRSYTYTSSSTARGDTTVNYGADSVAITVNGVSMFAYVVRGINLGRPQPMDSTGIDLMARVSFSGTANTEGDTREPYPDELIEGLARMSDSGAWASDADTTSFAKLHKSIPLPTGYIVWKTEKLYDLVLRIADAFKFDLFITRGGKLSVALLEPEGGASPAYSSALTFTEEDDILSGSVNAVLPQDGSRHGLINEINVESYSIPVQSSGVETSRIKNHTFSNSTSQTRHDRVSVGEINGAPFVRTFKTAQAVAQRILSLYDDPRLLFSFSTLLRATQLELGDIVKISHSAVPGWLAERLCWVEQIVEDLDDYTTAVTVVDYDDALNAKAFVYSSVENTDVKGGSGLNRANITNGSSVITFSGASPNINGVEVGDIFSLEGWGGATNTLTNRLNAIITAVDTGTPTLTLSDSGGLDGPRNSTYTNETSIQNWKVFASQATRDSASRGEYSTAIADNRGAYCDDADDLFRDNTTAPYVYQRAG